MQSAVLAQAVEQLEYGRCRHDAASFASVVHALSDDASSVAPGPKSYFQLRSDGLAGAAPPIDIPLIPFPAPESGSGGGGWAFATWLQLSTPGKLDGGVSDGPSLTPITVARLQCGAGGEAEILLAPTESPQQYKLVVRTAMPSSASSFRSGKRSQAEGVVRLGSMRWHHIAVSETQPLLGMINIKSPKLTAYVDGRAVFEQDMALPPIPFTRAGLGLGLDGCLAHPTLYAERLPPMHVMALYCRGPNAATLQHALSKPLPQSVAPELQRAGLVTSASLDTLHEGMPLVPVTTVASAAGKGPGGRGDAQAGVPTKAVPPVLFHLDAEACIPASSSHGSGYGSGMMVSASEGLVVDRAGPVPDVQLRGVERAKPGHATPARRASLSPGSHGPLVVGVVCPLWWSKGEAWGDAVLAGRKVYPAILAIEARLGNPVLMPAAAGGHASSEASAAAKEGRTGSAASAASANGSGSATPVSHVDPIGHAFVARLGPSVTVVTDSTAGPMAHGGLIVAPSDGHPSLPPFRLAGAWPSVGGVMRVLDLLRVVPLQVGAGAASGHGTHGTADSHLHLQPSSGPSPLLTDPVSSILCILSCLLRDDHGAREDFYQLRGFAALTRLLTERIENTERSRASAAAHGLGLGYVDADGDGHASGAGQSNIKATGAGATATPQPSPRADESSMHAWNHAHPVSPSVWRRCTEVVASCRAYGSAWGPLFSRALRFLICETRLWTRQVQLQGDGHGQHTSSAAAAAHAPGPAAAGTPSLTPGGHASSATAVAAALDAYCRSYGAIQPCHPAVLSSYGRYVSDLAASSARNFARIGGMDLSGACDALVASSRSLAATSLHAQVWSIAARTAELDNSKAGLHASQIHAVVQSLPERLSGFAPALTHHGFQLSDDTLASSEALQLAVSDVIASWVRTVRLLLCLSVGAPVPVPTLGDGSGVAASTAVPSQAQTPFDPDRTALDVGSLLACIAVLLDEHKKFQAGQDAMLACLAHGHGQAIGTAAGTASGRHPPTAAAGGGAGLGSGSQGSSRFVWCAVDKTPGSDPFAHACAALLDLLGSMLRAHPAALHPPFEVHRGTFIVTACAEADCEAVRVSAINIITAVIALRRVTDPRLYGEDGGTSGAGGAAAGQGSGAGQAGAPAAAGTGPTAGHAQDGTGKFGDGSVAPPPVPPVGSSTQATPTAGASGAQAAPTFAAAGRAAVLSAKEKQARLLRVLCNALAGRPYTTSASALAALQLALAPDVVSVEGGAGAGPAASGAAAQGAGAGKAGAAGPGSRMAGRGRAGTTSAPLSAAYEDADLPLPGGGDMAAGGMSTALTGQGGGSAVLTCPDALPIVFLCLGATTTRLYKRGRLVSALKAAGPWASPVDVGRRLGLPSLEAAGLWADGIESPAIRAADEDDNANRLRVLLDLSLLLKRRPSNAMSWMRQPGWQLWILDLMSLPRARKVSLRIEPQAAATPAAGKTGPRLGPSYVAVVADDVSSSGHPYADVHRARSDTGGSIGHSGAGRARSTSSVLSSSATQRSIGSASAAAADSTNSAIAAMASDIFASLLCAALEVPDGWRVWISTLPAIAERCRKDHKVRTWAGLEAAAARAASHLGHTRAAGAGAAVPAATAARPPIPGQAASHGHGHAGRHTPSGSPTADRTASAHDHPESSPAGQTSQAHGQGQAPADPVFEDEVSSALSHVICLVLDRVGRERPRLTSDLRQNLLRTLRLAESRIHGAPYEKLLTSALPVIAWLRGGVKTIGQGPAGPASGAAGQAIGSTSTASAGSEPLRGQEVWLILQILVKGLPIAAGQCSHVPGLALAAAAGLLPGHAIGSAGAAIAVHGTPSDTHRPSTHASGHVTSAILRPSEGLLSDLCATLQSLISEEVRSLYDPEEAAFQAAQAAALSIAGTRASVPSNIGGVLGRLGAGLGGIMGGSSSSAQASSGASGRHPGLTRESSLSVGMGSGSGGPSSLASSAASGVGAVGLGLVAGTGARPGEGSRVEAVLYILSGLQRAVDAARICAAVAEADVQEEMLASGLGLGQGATAVPSTATGHGYVYGTDGHRSASLGDLQGSSSSSASMELGGSIHEGRAATVGHMGSHGHGPSLSMHGLPHAHSHGHHHARVSAAGYAGPAQSCLSLALATALAVVNTAGLGAWETTVGQYKDVSYMRGKGRLIPPGGFRNPAAAAALPPKTPAATGGDEATVGFGGSKPGALSMARSPAPSLVRPTIIGSGKQANIRSAALGLSGPGEADSSGNNGDADLFDVQLNSSKGPVSSPVPFRRGGAAGGSGAAQPFDPFAAFDEPQHGGARTSGLPAPSQRSTGSPAAAASAAAHDPFSMFDASAAPALAHGHGHAATGPAQSAADHFDAFGPSAPSASAGISASPARPSHAPAKATGPASDDPFDMSGFGDGFGEVSVSAHGAADGHGSSMSRMQASGPALGDLIGQAVMDSYSVVLTEVAPPPLERARAMFAALEPGLLDIRQRMESSSFADFLQASLQGPGAAGATGGANATAAGSPAASTAADEGGHAADTAVSASTTVPSQQSSSSSGPTQLWLRELLAAEKRPVPHHPITTTIDTSPLRSLRQQLVDCEGTRANKLHTEADNRRKMVQAHWTAVRIDLLRTVRIAARARARARAREATARGHRSGAPGHELEHDTHGDGTDDEAEDRPRLQRAGSLPRLRADSTAYGSESVFTTDPFSVGPPPGAGGSVTGGQTGTGGTMGILTGPSLEATFEPVIEPVKVDSHEDRSRARYRLLTSKAPVLVAPTYVEYGRKGQTPGAGTASETTAAAAASLGGTGTGTDIAKALRQAGAIKNVATAAARGNGEQLDADDDDDAEARADENALRANAAGGAGGAGGDVVTAEGGGEDDDEGDDPGDAASTVASTVTGSVGTSASAEARRAAAAAAGAAGHGASTAVVPEDLHEAENEGAGPGAVAAAARSAKAVGGLAARFGPRILTAKALLVKAGGAGAGTVALLPSGVLVWEPRPANEAWDPDSPIGGPDPDSVLPPKRARRWNVSDITALFLRCYRLTDSAAELFVTAYGGSRKRRAFLAFESAAKRDEVVRAVITAMPRSVIERLADRLGQAGASLNVSVNVGTGSGPSIYGSVSGHSIGFAYVQVPRPVPGGQGSGASSGFAHNYEHHFRRIMSELVTSWRSRRISNFDYLLALNTLAGRSFNDLAQYPVMPWIVGDYTSEVLDTSRPSAYRDLSRPMGALTGSRLRDFRAKFDTWEDDDIPKFLYGSHYSTAVGTVIHYLLRLHPFTRLHVTYQSGHYDVADRLFESIQDAWHLNTTSLSEVKEITPEWYSSAHYLVNTSRYKFGNLQNGTPVDHVRLPPWAGGSPARFIRIMREAMESEAVSSMLHAWVDLVFGYKQTGPNAVASDNVFYYLTYAGGVDLDAIEEPALKRATQSQITHYGQTPLQLSRMPQLPRGPHPTVAPPLLPLSPAAALTRYGPDNMAVVTALPKAARPPAVSTAGLPGSGAGGADGRAALLSRFTSSSGAGTGGTAGQPGPAAGYVGRGDTIAQWTPPQRLPGSVPAGLARPLTAELRAYAQVLGLKDTPGPSGVLMAKLDLPTPAVDADEAQQQAASAGHSQSSSTRHMPAGPPWRDLPFSLIPTRAFSHVCTVPQSGFSVWRPDTPSALPFGLYEALGPHATPEASQFVHSLIQKRAMPQAVPTPAEVGRGGSGRGQHGDATPSGAPPSQATGPSMPVPLAHVSFGDVLVLGSAAPPAALTLRVPAPAAGSVVDMRGPDAPAWPVGADATGQAGTRTGGAATDPLDAFSSSTPTASAAGAAHDGGPVAPFALPIGYRCLFEVPGSVAVPPPGTTPVRTRPKGFGLSAGNGLDTPPGYDVTSSSGHGRTGTVGMDAADGDGAGDGDGDDEDVRPPPCNRFHVWWPIAPRGYVALGCVVTQATHVKTYTSAVGADTAQRATGLDDGPSQTPSAGTSSAPASPAAVRGAAPVPVPAWTWTVQRVTPSPDAVVCPHVSGVTPALLKTFVPCPNLMLNPSESFSPNTEVGLQACKKFVASGAADGLKGGRGLGSGSEDNDSPFDGLSPSPSSSLPPWITPHDGLASPALALALGLGSGAAGASAPGASATSPRDGAFGMSSKTSDGASGDLITGLGSSADTITDALDDGIPPDASPEEIRAYRERNSSVAALLCSTGKPAIHIARLRAAKSRGMALWTVGNRAGTFVAPVPLALLRRSEAGSAMTDVTLSPKPSGFGFNGLAGGNNSSGVDSVPSTPNVTGGATSPSSAPGRAPLPDEVALVSRTGLVTDMCLACPPLPPVPEVASDTFHRAHAHAAAVSYDFAPWLAARTLVSNACVEPSSGALRRGIVSFAEQHWTADSAVTGVQPVNVQARHVASLAVALPSLPAGAAAATGRGQLAMDMSHPLVLPMQGGAHSGTPGRDPHPWDALVPMTSAWRGQGHESLLPTPVTRYSIKHDSEPGSLALRPAIVAIRILGGATVAASALSNNTASSNSSGGAGVGPGGASGGGPAGGPGSMSAAGLLNTSAPQHTVLVVDAAGNVDRFRVLAQATYPQELLSAHLDGCSAACARARGLPIIIPGMPDGSSFVPHRLSQKMLPHVRVRLVRDGPAVLPRIPLVGFSHVCPLPPSLTNTVDVPGLEGVAHRTVPAGMHGPPGTGQGTSGPAVFHPRLVTHPVVLTDMFAGGVAVSGCGPGQGLTVNGVDVRASPTAVYGGAFGGGGGQASGMPGSGLPLVPLAPRKSGLAAGADNLKRSVLSTVAGGGGELVVEAPSWCGSEDLALAGQLSLPGTQPGVCATVMTVDVDLIAVGHSDGSVALWRASGLEPLSTLLALPGLKPRPDRVFRGNAAAGPVINLALSRDDDICIVGYAREAWVFEVARGRPLQRFDLDECFDGQAIEALGLADVGIVSGADRHGAASVPGAPVSLEPCLSPPVCVGTAVTSDGGIVLATTCRLMVQATAPTVTAPTVVNGSGPGTPHASSGSGVPPQAEAISAIHAGQPFSTLTLYGSNATAVSAALAPVATAAIPARVTCLTRVRAGGTGDVEGPGALIAVGRSDGVLTLYDGRDLSPLVSWTTAGRLPIHAIDVSPCTSYIVAGCSNGTVAVFALPAFLTSVAVEDSVYGRGAAHRRGDGTTGTDGLGSGGVGHGLDSLLDGLGAGLSNLQFGAQASGQAVGQAVASSAAEGARSVAKLGKALAGEAGSVVKGLFGSVFGGKSKDK